MLFISIKKNSEIQEKAQKAKSKMSSDAEVFLTEITEKILEFLPENIGVSSIFCPNIKDIRMRDLDGTDDDEIHFHANIPLSPTISQLITNNCSLWPLYSDLLLKNGYTFPDSPSLAFCAGLDEGWYQLYEKYAQDPQDWTQKRAQEIKIWMEKEAEKKCPGYAKDAINGSRAAYEKSEELRKLDQKEKINYRASKEYDFACRRKEDWLVICLAVSDDTVKIMVRVSGSFDPHSDESNQYKWPIEFVINENDDKNFISSRILSSLSNKEKDSFSPR